MRTKVRMVEISIEIDKVGVEALGGIKRGLADVEAGRVTPLDRFEQDFREKHDIPRRPR